VSHYDSVIAGPGANDDGTAVAALLETIRALRAGPPIQNDVVFLFTDGEEAGLLGAKAFVDEHPLAREIGLVLNFEARGNSGPVLMFETSPDNGWLIQEFARAAPAPFASSLFYDVYRTLPNNTDFTLFKEAGFAGLNFAYIDGDTYYHSPLDNIANVGERSLQHHGVYALALTRHFGNLSLENTKGSDAVYFNILGSALVRYPGGWIMPLLILVALGTIAVIVLGFRARLLTFWGLVLGFLAFLIILIIPAAIVALIAPVLGAMHSEFPYYGDTYNPQLYLIGFVALAIATTSALYVLFRRKIRVYNLAMGGLLWWLILAAITSLAFPGGSYLFVWPLLFSLLELAALFAVHDPEHALTKRLVVLLLCAIPGIILFAPIIYMLFITLTMRLAAAPVVGTVLLLSLLIPHLTLMTTTNRWLLPGAAALGSLGLLLVGSFTTGVDVRNPRPNNVMYGLNADTSQALWASTDLQTDEWTSQFLTAGVQRGTLGDFFPWSPRTFLQTQAPAVALAAPQVALLDDRTSAGTRTLRVRITSPRQAPFVGIYLDPHNEVLGATVNGKPIAGPPPAAPGTAGTSPPGGQWGMLYWALPPEGIELALQVGAGQPVRVRVVDRSDGLPEIPGASFKPRPDYMVPAPSLGVVRFSNSTMVSKTFAFEARP
jgi:hypothetical protein